MQNCCVDYVIALLYHCQPENNTENSVSAITDRVQWRRFFQKIQLDFKMSEMIDPFISQTYVPNYFIPGLRWTAMAWVTYHSAQQTWEGRRKKRAKDKPLVRDFRFLEDHLPTWWFVHGKQNVNGKERNFSPIIFCMFFSVFPPRPSHTSHPHTPPDGWPWSPGFLAHFLSSA